MLERIVQSAVDLADATYGALGVLDDTGTRLAQFITVGIDDEAHRAIGNLPEGHGILGLYHGRHRRRDPPRHRQPPGGPRHPGAADRGCQAAAAARPDRASRQLRVPAQPPADAVVPGRADPLRDEVFGNLYLTDKRSGEVFTDVDEELVVGLAAAAGVAIENARLHTKLHELALVEDRERIARDLHDTVIQRLFATGMSLQGAVRLIAADPAAAGERIDGAVDDLDLTVKHIRTAIFGLEQRTDQRRRPSPASCSPSSARRPGSLGFEPRVLLDGPARHRRRRPGGRRAPRDACGRRSATSSRHAQASRVDVEVCRRRRRVPPRDRRRDRTAERVEPPWERSASTWRPAPRSSEERSPSGRVRTEARWWSGGRRGSSDHMNGNGFDG